MSWIEFKNYQEKAIVKLKKEVNELLDSEGNKICIFKAPTGSGKTLMMAEFLRRLIDSRVDGKKFSFIWLAVNKLHDQSRQNLKKYYDQQGVGLKCSNFDDLEDRRISENEILFFNWASINKKDNIYIRENERDNNLSSVVTRTKQAGSTIILIIDESHHTADSDKSKALIDEIGPKVTVEVSATPQLKGSFHGVEVELREVREEGVIKDKIAINPGFESFVIDRGMSDVSADELVIKVAIEKRDDLLAAYRDESSDVNPLILVQIPDAKQGIDDKKDALIGLLGKYGITTNNGRLAIYLSDKDNKINLDNIEKNTNEVEVMIFKQAIALGWDCPRAQILVLFRQWSKENITFSIQTVGRIMRMPELHHYKNPDLNIGYVYTSLSDISIAEDIAKDYITVYESLRNEAVYKSIDLTSYHSKRFREETRLSPEFTKHFLDACHELDLEHKILLKPKALSTSIMTDGIILNSDEGQKEIEKRGTVSIIKTSVELQQLFDLFARENTYPFAPELRSISRIKESIYKYFRVVFQMDVDDWDKIQLIVLAPENRQFFIDSINKAKESYQATIGKGKAELVQNDESWNVPRRLNFNSKFVKKNYSRSIMQPYFARTSVRDSLSRFEEDSEVEVAFIKLLEDSDKVLWWFKNGTKDGSFFAVPYTENDVLKPFYVDFIVQFKDGRIGLFDTKSGMTAQLASDKAEGLARYILDQNKFGKNLFGGIVIQKDGSWRLSDKTKYEYTDDISDWSYLSF